MRIIIASGFPNIIICIVIRLQETVNIIFLGRLNDPHLLQGIGIGLTMINLMGMSIIKGINMALETLVSQAAGAGNLELCGVYLNRGRFVMSVIFIFVVLECAYVEDILLYFNWNEKVCLHA